MTPTGTNLLGLVKHVASVELGYFTEVFGRDPGRELPWFRDEAEPDADLWVPVDETRQEIVDLHHHSARLSDATIAELELDAPGVVPWWPPGTGGDPAPRSFVHMLVETAGTPVMPASSELIDGHAGMGPNDRNLTSRTAQEWVSHVARIEDAARRAGHQ